MARFNPRPAIARFLANEAAGGLVLTAAAAVALIVANSPLSSAYHALVEAPVLGVTPLEVVNDGLMALFFLLVGMEIKRELVSGELSSWQQRMLPGLAAAGGMLVPALIYAAINLSSPATLRGWAIPSATDIAFSLAVMTLLGSRVPTSLKVFLAALAIIDDLGAIIIIALFYASGIDPLMLLFALAAFLVLVFFNLLDLRNL
ncbi:MAG: Na+/H+ antiporter NhaA, partial [Rhizobiales bacterium]|nr:Na+/H+ antiporter NhaA [Hyphomicrobiales bacterium]